MNQQIANNLKNILAKIQDAATKRPEELQYFMPRLVAVSKTKPITDIIEAYNAGQRNFGENYADELVEKANSLEIQANCPEIRWHFIGNLQSNKVKKVLSIPNLFLIETIDSVKKAELVNKTCVSLNRQTPVDVMIQVNTSGEEQKNGLDKDEATSLYEHIMKNLKNLHIRGLMTIGSVEASLNNSELNKDFLNLVKCKEEITQKYGVKPSEIELSMGMSNDFERAISLGSSNVRVGSLIFGSRL